MTPLMIQPYIGMHGPHKARREVLELVGIVLEAASGLTSAEDRIIALTEAAQVGV